MKIVIAALLALALADPIVDKINSNTQSTWRAKEYPPEIINTAKVRAMCGTKVSEGGEPAPLDRNDLPVEFDSRERWPGKLQPIRDQGHCGSCWAHAVAETAEHRLSIQGCDIGRISPQDLVSCDIIDLGCDGGAPIFSWEWAHYMGLATEDCIPYVSGDGLVPTCPRECVNGSDIHRVKAQKIGYVDSHKLQQNLMEYGPFELAFMVYEDFMTYAEGVYQHLEGVLLGGHAVVLIGWGVHNDVPYWIVQNSWGADWGEEGFFRIIRGENECGIEQNGWQGQFSC